METTHDRKEDSSSLIRKKSPVIRPGYKWAPWKYSNWRLLNWQQAQWNIFKTLLNSRIPLLESIFGRWGRQTTDVRPMQAVGSVRKADLDTHSEPNKGPWSHFKGVTMCLPSTEEQGLSLYLTGAGSCVHLSVSDIGFCAWEKEPHRDCPVVCPGSVQSPSSMFLYTQALELALPLHVVWLQVSNFSKRSHISNTPNTPSKWHNFIKTSFSYWLMFLPLHPTIWPRWALNS